MGWRKEKNSIKTKEKGSYKRKMREENKENEPRIKIRENYLKQEEGKGEGGAQFMVSRNIFHYKLKTEAFEIHCLQGRCSILLSSLFPCLLLCSHCAHPLRLLTWPHTFLDQKHTGKHSVSRDLASSYTTRIYAPLALMSERTTLD